MGQFCYLQCQPPGPCTTANSWENAINDATVGLPNYFTWLNIHNPNPPKPGTIRQGFSQTTVSVNPYVATTVWDEYIVRSVYDSLYKVNPLNPSQLIAWAVVNTQQLTSVSYNGGVSGPPPGTVTTFRFILSPNILFQDGRQVTSYDAAFSYLSMVGSGAPLGASAAGCFTGVTIVGPRQFDIGVNGGISCSSPLPSIVNLPIVPGFYWSNSGRSAWDSAVRICGTSTCQDVQYTLTGSTVNCTGTCASFPASLMTVNPSEANASFDPVLSNIFVGFGPFSCGTVTTSGSGVCTTTGTQSPPLGGSYTLTAFKRFFHSIDNLSLWIWAADGDPNGPSILTVTSIGSCVNVVVNIAGPCGHWQQGAGNPSSGPVGIIVISIVYPLYNINWLQPNNWQTSPPQGIVPGFTPVDPLLHGLSPSGGSTTLTPSPTGPNGISCSTPNPYYDC